MKVKIRVDEGNGYYLTDEDGEGICYCYSKEAAKVIKQLIKFYDNIGEDYELLKMFNKLGGYVCVEGETDED